MNVTRECTTSGELIEAFMENHRDDPVTNKQISQESMIRMGMSMLNIRSGLIETMMNRDNTNIFTESTDSDGLIRVGESGGYKWPYLVAPYFTLPEIVRLNNYYYEQPVQDIELISNLYLETHPGEIKAHGFRSDYNMWHNKVEELMNDLKLAEDPDEIARIKQDLVNHGWNPEVDFSEANIERARNRIERIMTEHINSPSAYGIDIAKEQTDNQDEQPKNEELVPEPVFRAAEAEVIDISQEDSAEDGNMEEASIKNLFPISIILVDGKSTFSKVIKTATLGDYSHSAVCIDSDFDNLYSFNLHNKYNANGGFSLEKMSEYDKRGKAAIFTVYLPKIDYESIRDRCKTLKDNIKNTTYSIANILLLPFVGINLNNPVSMICSQFVDSLLKMGHVDISNINSSKVTPNTIYRKLVKNPKVYKVFDGYIKEFNEKKVRNLINKYQKKGMAYNEMGITEIEDLKEYAAQLYYDNYVLERTLYSNANLDIKEENRKLRAKILNEFRTSVEQIMADDPEFCFDDYYKCTDYYDDTYEYNVPDLPKMKEILKDILSQ